MEVLHETKDKKTHNTSGRSEEKKDEEGAVNEEEQALNIDHRKENQRRNW